VARSKRGYVLALLLAAAVVFADQATKWVVRSQAEHLPRQLVAGLRIDLTYNSGISFSRFAGAGDVVVVLVAELREHATQFARLVAVEAQKDAILRHRIGGAITLVQEEKR